MNALEISWTSPLTLTAQFTHQKGTLLLDSSDPNHPLSQYSYLCIDPFAWFEFKHHKTNPFDEINDFLQNYAIEPNPDLPPFQGGLAGFFGYDLGRHLETIPNHAKDDMEFPDCALGAYDLLISFDHKTHKAWIVSDKHARIDWLYGKLNNNQTKIQLRDHPYSPINQNQIKADLTQTQYEQAVQKTIEYVLAGDIFEANFTQRFTAPLSENSHPFGLYKRLRQFNPAPFSAYFNVGATVLASASPERFIQLKDNVIDTRPIKGTRPRHEDPIKDTQLGEELLASEKDWAENVMIVDLMRNDLSRVCEDHSVVVKKLCSLESFATVHHLVSVVEGKLKKNYNAVDLLKATFPGGSITGAPKIRAMEIIEELEPTRRGPYCGSIGYLGFDGCMDTSIVIRTFAIKDNKITFQAGGAVVADSSPKGEYVESLDKARGLKRALTE